MEIAPPTRRGVNAKAVFLQMPYCSFSKYSPEGCRLFVMEENHLVAVSWEIGVELSQTKEAASVLL